MLCPPFEQFEHFILGDFPLVVFCHAAKVASCFCRVSHAWESCAFISIHAIISLDVSDVPDVVKKLMRFSLMDSCLPSNACNRNPFFAGWCSIIKDCGNVVFDVCNG